MWAFAFKARDVPRRDSPQRNSARTGFLITRNYTGTVSADQPPSTVRVGPTCCGESCSPGEEDRSPWRDRLGGIGQHQPLGLGLARHEQAHVVFLVGPIQADEGGILGLVGGGVHGRASGGVGCRTRWLWLGEGIIAETLGTSASGGFVERTRAHRPRAKR